MSIRALRHNDQAKGKKAENKKRSFDQDPQVGSEPSKDTCQLPGALQVIPEPVEESAPTVETPPPVKQETTPCKVKSVRPIQNPYAILRAQILACKTPDVAFTKKVDAEHALRYSFSESEMPTPAYTPDGTSNETTEAEDTPKADIAKRRRKDRKRLRLGWQYDRLESLYQTNKQPSLSTISQIATSIQVHERSVLMWFSMARKKEDAAKEAGQHFEFPKRNHKYKQPSTKRRSRGGYRARRASEQ